MIKLNNALAFLKENFEQFDLLYDQPPNYVKVLQGFEEKAIFLHVRIFFF